MLSVKQKSLKGRRVIAADPVNQLIAQQIRRYRLARGLTMNEVGEKVGLTYQQIQKYEKGVSQLSLPMLIRFAAALHFSAACFIAELTDPEPAVKKRDRKRN